MPGNHPDPGIQWAGGVDLSGIYGTDCWERDADPVQITDAWFEDLLELLNGRGSASNRSLPGILALTLADWAMLLDETDRCVIHGPFDQPFSMEPGADNAVYGFDPVGQASVLGTIAGLPRQVLRASREWQRINPVNERRFTIRVGAVMTTLPPAGTYVQDVLTHLRTRGSADIDDPTTTCMEALDNAEHDPVNNRIRWGVDALGHVWCAYPSFAGAITWLNVKLQRLLGFRDSDAPIDVGSLKLYRASDPPAPGLVPSRSARIVPGVEELRYGGDLTGGDAVNNVLFEHFTRHVTWHLDGPDDIRNLSSHYDHRHRRTWQHQVTLYQQWPGEIRRALPEGVRIDRGLPAYSLAYTSEEDGERGRLVCTVSTKNSTSRRRAWTGNHRRKGTEALTLNIRSTQWP